MKWKITLTQVLILLLFIFTITITNTQKLLTTSLPHTDIKKANTTLSLLSKR